MKTGSGGRKKAQNKGVRECVQGGGREEDGEGGRKKNTEKKVMVGGC